VSGQQHALAALYHRERHGTHFTGGFTQYCAGYKIEKNELGVARSAYGGGEDVYRVSVGKPEGKTPLGRPRPRWEDNIKQDIQEVGCGGMDWIDLAQDRERWRAPVNAVMNLRAP